MAPIAAPISPGCNNPMIIARAYGDGEAAVETGPVRGVSHRDHNHTVVATTVPRHRSCGYTAAVVVLDTHMPVTARHDAWRPQTSHRDPRHILGAGEVDPEGDPPWRLGTQPNSERRPVV